MRSSAGERARRIGRLSVDCSSNCAACAQDVPAADRLQHRRLQLDRLAVDLFEARADFFEVRIAPP